MFNQYDFNVYLLIILSYIAILQNDDQIYFLKTEWFQNYWTISLPIAAVYISIVLFSHKVWKKQYEPIGHRRLLKYWNFALSVFSVFGAYRVCSEFVQTFNQHGLVDTFCKNHYFQSRSVYFWYCMFVLSKAVEMGDTMFLIAGNKPVRFIHWYHHTVTMIYSFYIAVYLPAIGRWMCSMNFIVHSLMYTYYFITAHQLKISPKISMIITTLQTVQMFIGLFVNTAAFVSEKFFGYSCQNGGYTAEAGIILYSSYVILFVNLFHHQLLQATRINKLTNNKKMQ